MSSTAMLKKIAFAPIFLILAALTFFQLTPTFGNSSILLSLDLNTAIQLILITLLIILTAISFIIFTAISDNFRITIPIIMISGIFPVIFFPTPLNYFLSAGFMISLILSLFIVDNKLKTYLTFQPNNLFSPPAKQLAGFIILIISFGYFLSVSQTIKKEGFQIPDSIIDASLSLTPMPNELDIEKTTNSLNLPQIPQEQIDLLKQNPELLKQYGLDPSILDTINAPTQQANTNRINPTQDLIKQSVKQQVNNMLKPYLSYIPAFLAVGLFLTLKSFSAVLSWGIGLIFWIIFYILEKTGFLTFTTEMREVKKMVV